MAEIKSLNKLLKQYPKFAKEIANGYANHYKTFFKKGGYYKGSTFVPWKNRQKEKIKRSRSGRVRKRIAVDDGILVESGDLKDSIHVKSYSAKKIVIESDSEYAARHNRGLDGMPKRPFFTNDNVIKKKNIKLVKRLIRKSLKR